MKCETVSAYEDRRADQANGPWLVHAAKFLFITHFFPLREVLFSLGAPLFFSRLIRTIKSVERRNNEKNQLENYLFCHFTAFCPETGIAMHIMEGFLPIEWAIFWWAVTLPFLILGSGPLGQKSGKTQKQK